VALSRVAALEAARHGVLVNTVCPGYIATELTRVNNPPDVLAGIEAQIPMGRLGTPEEVAALVAWLVSARNGYLTGQVLTIDGGYTAA
jgi:NAD(P)-dependent dehydrogenase (short-subunit alcohol dehydrogenase family)